MVHYLYLESKDCSLSTLLKQWRRGNAIWFLPSSDGAERSLIHNVIHHLSWQESLNSASRSTWRWPERCWADELTRNLVFQPKTAPSLKAFKCAASSEAQQHDLHCNHSEFITESWIMNYSEILSSFKIFPFHFSSDRGLKMECEEAKVEPSDKVAHSSNFTLCYSVIASKHRKHRRRVQPPVPDLAPTAHWALWPMSFLHEVSALARIIKYSAVLP